MPCGVTSVGHTDISEGIFYLQLCFQHGASGPLGPWNFPTKPVFEGHETFSVAISQSPGCTYETVGSPLTSSITTTFYAFLETETYRFTGKPYSSATGLYYSFQRWYGPEIGRFISQDPILGSLSYPQTLNRYTYVANDPVGYSDPSGLIAPLILALVLVGIGIGVGSGVYVGTSHPEWGTGADFAFIGAAFLGPPGLAASASYFASKDVSSCVSGQGCDYLSLGLDAMFVLSLVRGPGSLWRSLTRTTSLADDPIRAGIGTESLVSTSSFWRTLERSGTWTNRFQIHHLLPREFESFFKAAGLRIDDYVVELQYDIHKVIQGKGGSILESYNADWAEFIARHRHANPAEILDFLAEMAGKYLP